MKCNLVRCTSMTLKLINKSKPDYKIIYNQQNIQFVLYVNISKIGNGYQLQRNEHQELRQRGNKGIASSAFRNKKGKCILLYKKFPKVTQVNCKFRNLIGSLVVVYYDLKIPRSIA